MINTNRRKDRNDVENGFYKDTEFERKWNFVKDRFIYRKKGLDEKNLYLEKNDRYNKVLYKEYQEWYFLNCNK